MGREDFVCLCNVVFFKNIPSHLSQGPSKEAALTFQYCDASELPLQMKILAVNKGILSPICLKVCMEDPFHESTVHENVISCGFVLFFKKIENMLPIVTNGWGDPEE